VKKKFHQNIIMKTGEKIMKNEFIVIVVGISSRKN
jgi:hypothetical protein